jgi:hypothetical protein
MHTIIILSDTLTRDSHIVKKVEELFPDCTVRLFSKTVQESGIRDIDPILNGYSQKYNFNNQNIETADDFRWT